MSSKGNTVKCKGTVKKYVDYLYIRGEVFYYRRRIPKKHCATSEFMEIRLSLQTDSYKEAKQKAIAITSHLHTLFKARKLMTPEEYEQIKLFMEKKLADVSTKIKPVEPSKTVIDVHNWLNEHGYDYSLDEVVRTIHFYHPSRVSDFSPEKIVELLGDRKTGNLEYSEISERIVGYIRNLLCVDSVDTRSRTQFENRTVDQPLLGMNTPKDFGISYSSISSGLYTVYKAIIDEPPLLCLACLDFLNQLIQLNLFKREEIAYDNYMIIINEYCKFSLEYIEILQARLQKDYSKEKLFLTYSYKTYPIVQGNAETVKNPEITLEHTNNNCEKLSFYLDEYLKTKVTDGKKKEKYISELKSRIELFIRIIGDKAINLYERHDFRNFRDFLDRLPPNFTKRKDLKSKTIEEISKMEHEQTLSMKTINGYLIDVSAYFQWFVTEAKLSQNYATGLTRKEEKLGIESRDPFTSKDLHILFEHTTFKSYKKSNTPSMYWVPWIGLYTGMRLEEICQLYCSDLYKFEDTLWVIDININLEQIEEDEDTEQVEEDSRSLKTPNAKRIIPIHNHLKDIGFIDYVEEMKTKSERLFPDLEPVGDRKQYGKAISKNFGPFVRKIGIKGKKSFHSFRHTFSDFYKKKMMHNTIFEQVFGHSHGSLATDRYGSRFTPHECYEQLIVHLDYGLKLK